MKRRQLQNSDEAQQLSITAALGAATSANDIKKLKQLQTIVFLAKRAMPMMS